MSDDSDVDKKLLQGIATGVEVLTASAQASLIQRVQMDGKLDSQGQEIAKLRKAVEGNGEGLVSRVGKLELKLDFLEKAGTTTRSTMSDWLKIIVGAILSMLMALLVFKLTKM